MGEEDKLTKVNKVAVSLDDFDGCKITLYKTNTKLGELDNTMIGVPGYKRSKIPNKNTYLKYCKDIIINLLKNGGIDGFYYEEKVAEEPFKKYGRLDFMSSAREIIEQCLIDMNVDGRHVQYKLKSKSDDTCVNTTEKYKDGNIKFGVSEFDIVFTRGNKSFDATIQVHIRSGQLCKPKIMIVNNTEEKFNITTIVSMLK